MIRNFILLLSCLPLSLYALPDDNSSFPKNSWSLSTGHLSHTSDELVLRNNYSEKLSHLIWNTDSVPILQFSYSAQKNQSKKMIFNLEIGSGGHSHMADYDYHWPTVADGYSEEIANYDWKSQYEWTNKSTHEAILDSYLKCQIGYEKTYYQKNNFSLSLLMGASFYHYSWQSFGGELTYWDETITNNGDGSYSMNFIHFSNSPSKLAISYTIANISFLVGPVLNFTKNDLHFQLSSSLAYGAKLGLDFHHARDRIFVDQSLNNLMLSVGARVSKKITDNTSLFLQAQYAVEPLATAQTTIFKGATFDYLKQYPSGGFKSQSATVLLGFEHYL